MLVTTCPCSLSGRFTRDNLSEFTGYFDKLAVECYASEENFLRLDAAKKMADAKGMQLSQIALAYVLSYPLDTYAIVGSATPEEVRLNAEAADIQLTPEELGVLSTPAAE